MADWSYNASTGRYRCAGSRIDYEEALMTSCCPVPVGSKSVPIPWRQTGATTELLAKLASCAIERRQIDGVTADAPWRRHFSWARSPDEVVAEIVAWVRAQSRRANVECLERAVA
jgi:hypothetical protein